MINLSELWVKAGRPVGRAPSNYKATAAMKRRIAQDASVWTTTGRGAKSVTMASELVASEYAHYLKTGLHGSTKAQAEPKPEPQAEPRYTAEDMRQAYNSGRDAGYADGYVAGRRDAVAMGHASTGTSTSNDRRLDDVKSYINDCQKGRKAFARRFHPDRVGSTPEANDNMAFINGFFDHMEKIFARAA